MSNHTMKLLLTSAGLKQGHMPAREMGKSRLENMMYLVDAGIRNRVMHQNN